MAKKLTNEEIGTLKRAAEIVDRIADDCERNGTAGFQQKYEVASDLRAMAKDGQRRES